MKVLRHMLNETIVGALIYAVTCRLTESRPPAPSAGVRPDAAHVSR